MKESITSLDQAGKRIAGIENAVGNTANINKEQ